MDDLQAIRRLKHGDIGGLEYLVSIYQNKALKTAYLVTHDEQLAEDVVQDCFVNMFQRIRQFDETRPFEPYFMRSVTNAALNATLKSSKYLHVGLSDDMERIEKLFKQASNIESLVEHTLLKQSITSALAKLHPRQRAAIVMRYYLGMSEMEMARTLSAPAGTIKWLLNAARSRLRLLLGSERSAK